MKSLNHTNRIAAFAQDYPTHGRMRIDANAARNGQVMLPAPALNLAKPYFLSHFQQGNCSYVVSGTMRVISPEANPYLGILTQDTVSGQRAVYETEGDFYLPVHSSVVVGRYTSQANWVGKTAYLITIGDDWGITHDSTADGAIAVGTFKNGWDFRQNGIGWGSRFVHVTLQSSLRAGNHPVTVLPSVGECGCCFSECRVEAYPEVKAQHGLFIEFEINPFSANPLFEVSRVELNYTGQTETVIVDGTPITRPRTDLFTQGSGYFKVPFEETGTATITARVYVQKIDEAGCSCGTNGCCETFTFTVEVSDDSGFVCTPATPPAPTTNDWRILKVYADADVSAIDTTDKIKFGGISYDFTSPIGFDEPNDIEVAITEILTAQGVAFGAVTVTTEIGATDGDNTTLEVIITDVNAAVTIESLRASINGTTAAMLFEQV